MDNWATRRYYSTSSIGENINRKNSISELEMATHLMNRSIISVLDNKPTVPLTNKLSAKQSGLTGKLPRALIIRQKVTNCDTVITASIVEKEKYRDREYFQIVQE